jgi:site-specific recombinase XerD
LLQGNYDIRTVQEILGHKDVKPTMIYESAAFPVHDSGGVAC